MNPARLNRSVTRARLNAEPEDASPAEPGAYSRWTDPAPSDATRAALARSSERARAQRVARAAEGRCTNCGDRGHTANRCPEEGTR